MEKVLAEMRAIVSGPARQNLLYSSFSEHAGSTMGNRFDLGKFHNVILQNGALPLSLLEQQVKKYLAREREMGRKPG